jgi:HD-GYP domain-containing protein (c-di-GMP phosphodiesterase class II)
VADVVEAMSLDRPYRPALGVTAALETVTAGSGRLFDAGVVDACAALFAEGFTLFPDAGAAAEAC